MEIAGEPRTPESKSDAATVDTCANVLRVDAIELDRTGVRYDTPTPFHRIARNIAERWASWQKAVLAHPNGRWVRFSPPQASTLPFPSYVQAEQPNTSGTIPRLKCAFARPMGRGGRYSAARIDIGGEASLYGTGEHAGPLLRNGKVVECWNWDRNSYDEDALSLYQSHPFVLGVRADGTAFGLIAETTYRVQIDLGRGVTFRGLGPPFAVTAIEGRHPVEVVQTLSELTGKMELPPKWALGYQQCRWSYMSDARVREVAEEFRSRAIPCDVLWMDIDYMDGFRVFTFDQERFPDPRSLNAHLRARGYRSVYMLDPGIKVDGDYSTFQEGQDGNHFVRSGNGETFVGPVWPGDCAFPDFMRARTRGWWSEKVRAFMGFGMDGIWNDMNEPAVFREPDPTQTMPGDTRHDADPDFGGPDDHTRYHNLYGMLMARATREGMLAAQPGRRPFVLSRANFLGGQRYAAAWTGDNVSDWAHLGWSIPMVLSLGLCGQPFSGPDIGGFVGDADGPLFARWMGIGSLLPFSRGHSVRGSKDHEPWSFGPEVEATCRAALERRMRLMPYIYTCFYEASVSGRPICAPVFFADPKDPSLRAVEAAFLLGPEVCVCASVEPDAPPAPCPLPGWKAFEPIPVEPTAGRDLPDLYLRPGALLPLGPVMQHVDQAPLDPLTLVAHLGPDGRARGILYEDAGDGFAYREGEYRLTHFEAVQSSDGSLSYRTTKTEGQGSGENRTIHLEALES